MKRTTFFVLILSQLLCLGTLVAQEATKNVNYRLTENIAYKANDKDSYAQERCKIDVYTPSQSGFSTIVWFHGGSLVKGEKSIPKALKDKGVAVVGVNYRLQPKATIDQCIDDAAAAVAWVRQHISEYGGDPRKIYICGHSAGGYLCGMIGFDKKWLSAYKQDPDSLAGLLLLSGQMITHFSNRQAAGISPKTPLIDAYAPALYVRDNGIPVVIVTGDRELEMLGRYEENAYFWRMLKVNGHQQAYLYEVQGHNHSEMQTPGFLICLKHVKR